MKSAVTTARGRRRASTLRIVTRLRPDEELGPVGRNQTTHDTGETARVELASAAGPVAVVRQPFDTE